VDNPAGHRCLVAEGGAGMGGSWCSRARRRPGLVPRVPGPVGNSAPEWLGRRVRCRGFCGGAL